MKTSSSLSFLIFTSLLLTGVAIASLAPAFGSTASAKAVEQGNGFAYELETTGERSAVINVKLDVDSAEALQKYREANRQRASALLVNQPGSEIEVQITFAQPVSPADVRAKALSTGLTIHSYLLVGRSPQGRKITTIHKGAIPEDVTGLQRVTLPNGEEGGTLRGVILIKGTLKASPESLGTWLNDPSVYMVDTTGVEARQLASTRHADRLSGREVTVVLHSPFWRFDW